MNNRFTLLRLPNALCCRFTTASRISKQLEYNGQFNPICIILKQFWANFVFFEHLGGQNLSIVEQQLAIVEQQLAIVEQQLAIVEQQLAIVEQQLAIEEQQLAIEEQQLAIEEQQLAIEEQQLAIE
ncbi:MAG: hypothetical protein LBJ00_07015, partial [Planctomycetaceae bacterium]|nr:hypothetical protein [Planctomycetaceae bacterium]